MTVALFRPHIVGIGGTTKSQSSSEQALRLAIRAAEGLGALSTVFEGQKLAALPHYSAEAAKSSPEARALLTALRQADGVIISSPAYHGSFSGMVKNAIDFVEEMASDHRTYFDGLPVGLIVTAAGTQASGVTLAAMRSVVHALRGWPTPLGAAICVTQGLFQHGECTDPKSAEQLHIVGTQVAEFARLRHQSIDAAPLVSRGV